MKHGEETQSASRSNAMQRREFLEFTRNLAASGVLAHVVFLDESGGAQAAIAASQGYLLVDTKKCQGCLSCMLACSLVHEGVANLSLARIQTLQDSFQPWPRDVSIAQCRQCVAPQCVAACPTGALTADPRFGNVRVIDVAKCTGCSQCINACPYAPGRAMPVPEHPLRDGPRAAKCDLCATAKYHWDPAGGGPQGKQACVEVCPVKAIKFTGQVPPQTRAGYDVNLRDESWGRLGYPTD
jgi:protein NrfC